MDDILVPVSPGELIDKITILRLKADNIGDPAKRANVARELEALEAIPLPDHPDLLALTDELHGINARLWQIEDDIRDCDARGEFGEEFVALAQAVYRTNDRRAVVKREINLALGSTLIEEKSYVEHGGGS